MSDMAGAVVKSMAKWERKPAELYPTPPDCVVSLLPHLKSILPPGSVVLEPACADGNISKVLREHGYDTVDYDLRTDIKWGIGGVDFLNSPIFDEAEFDATFTNPPFKLAAKFIERSLRISPVVVMLLKSNYFHTKGRRELFDRTRPYFEYKLTWRPAFLEDERGNSPLMDCSWWVWVRGNTEDCRTKPIDRIQLPSQVGPHAPIDHLKLLLAM